nr:hypothetical protein [Candidatus Levybacteria bacterium]
MMERDYRQFQTDLIHLQESAFLAEDFFTPSWLGREVAKQRQKSMILEQTPWYYLSGTGFYVKEQVGQLIRNTRNSLSSVAPDVVEIELEKTKVDIEAFEDEYLKQMPGLKFNLAWEGEGGDRHIVCPDYNNTSWESVTDLKEREGVVAEVRKKVEEWLKTAPADSYAVIISPEGWSGFSDASGDAVHYKETQIYAIHTLDNGEIEARTFRYEANILENEELQRSLGLGIDEEPNQKERIKNALRNTLFVRGDDQDRSISSFEDIVNKMQSSVGGRETVYGTRTFAEIRSFLKNPEFYSKRNLLTERLIRRFQEYARHRISEGNVFGQELDLQIALGVTVAQLNKSYREIHEQENVVYALPRYKQDLDEMAMIVFASRANFVNYEYERKDLGLRPGCAGGGNEKVMINSMGVPRIGELTKKNNNETDDDYEFDHIGKCINCEGDPRALGPCDICERCDAKMGGKAAKRAA